MLLILFGFPRVGKTYYGEKLAKIKGAPFFDTDEIVSQRCGVRREKMYKELGEEKFRAVENNVIRQLIKEEKGVIALGGGGILQNKEVLKKTGRLVCLTLDKETIKERNLKKPQLGMFDRPDFEVFFENLYLTRLPLYEAISAYKIDLQGKKDENILLELQEIYDGQQ